MHTAFYFPYNGLGIFAVTMRGTPYVIGLCSQPVRRQAGAEHRYVSYRQAASSQLITVQSTSCTCTHKKFTLPWCDLETEEGEEVEGQAKEEIQESICLFWSRNSWKNALCFGS